MDEHRIRKPALPRRGPDPGDPETPELSLPIAAIPVGIDQRVLDLLLGHAVTTGAGAVIALRLRHDLAALLPGVDGSLHPWHRSSPRVGCRLLAEEPLDLLGLRADRGHAGDAALVGAALLDQEVVSRSLSPKDLAVHGHHEPLG